MPFRPLIELMPTSRLVFHLALRQLGWVRDRPIREEGHTTALACLADAHQASPLSKVSGDGTSSSSDGQCFR